MILEFDYSIENHFTRPVYDHHFSLLCLPMQTARQSLVRVSLEIHPCSYQAEDRDFFGNRYCYGEVLAPHTAFTVRMHGTAETGLALYEAQDTAHTALFTVQTGFTRPDDDLLAFWQRLHETSPNEPYERAVCYMHAVHKAMTYTKGVTTVKSTAADAFSLRQGVCQDYAHILLSLLRQSGIPARYVVGMLRGEGASHAWVEANCRGFWYGLDPTNDLLVQDEYIKISHGRDCEDCIVHRGVFKNLCDEAQRIKVLVEEQ